MQQTDTLRAKKFTCMAVNVNMHAYGQYTGADLGILEWWGCMTNVREKF